MLGYSVYVLKDPRNGEIRYVGIAKDTRKRMACHLCVPRDQSHRARWVRSLKREDLKPILSVLCLVEDIEEAKRLEIELIARYRSKGIRLTNTTDGGEGIINPTEESKERKRKSIERYWSDPSKREEARKRTLSLMTPERRAILSAHTSRNRIGFKHSEATKKKMSESWTDERRKKDPRRGKKRPTEVCRRISEGKKGKPRSEETKAKISATRKIRFASGAYQSSYPRNESGAPTRLTKKED